MEKEYKTNNGKLAILDSQIKIQVSSQEKLRYVILLIIVLYFGIKGLINYFQTDIKFSLLTGIIFVMLFMIIGIVCYFRLSTKIIHIANINKIFINASIGNILMIEILMQDSKKFKIGINRNKFQLDDFELSLREKSIILDKKLDF